MDINEKLKSLTPEQAKKLGSHLNSVYMKAEEEDRKRAAQAAKKPSTRKKKQERP